MSEQLDKAHIKKLLHNINSPLTTIIGYSSLLAKKHNPEWANTVKEEAKRVSEIVSELQMLFDEKPEEKN